MRAVLIVRLLQQFERRLKFGFVLDVEHPQQLFERRPHPFDVTIHPWALRFDALMTNAEPPQGEGEYPGGEDRFVVGSDLLWLAVMLDRIQQQAQ